MWTSSAIPYISLFCHQQTPALSISYFFHVPCTILFKVYFYTILFIFSFLFNRSRSETGVVNQIQMSHFRRRSTIDQLNVQTTTAEKEKLYTLSNIITLNCKVALFCLRSRSVSIVQANYLKNAGFHFLANLEVECL